MTHCRTIIILLFLATIFSSCYKDEIVSTETIDLISAERIYLNTIKGQVLDTLGQPIPSVSIEMADETVMTDEEGKFIIIDVMISSLGEFISATHPEFYDGGTRVYATAPITQTVQINLVPRGITQNFSNAQGATLKVADLTEVTVPANTFLANGQIYDGMVTLEVYTVNPNEMESFNKRLQVFEILEATSVENSILKSDFSSIMYIEAYDDSGEILTIGQGKKVKVNMPTYGASDHDNPVLYSFNEEIGFWYGEDNVIKHDGKYEVELPHFSWWGVGDQKVSSDLCITFTNVDESSDHLYTVSTTTGKVLQLGGVNYNEPTCFPAFANEILEVRVYNACFTEIYATSITTAAEGETNISIDVESVDEQGYLIEIEVVDCDFTPFQDTVTIFYTTDLSLDSLDRGIGTFDLQLDECFQSDQISFIAVHDNGNISYTYAEQVILNRNQSQYNIQIVACQDVMPLDGQMTINGVTYSEVRARQNPQETLIIATDGENEFVLGFDGFEIGTFPGRLVSFGTNVFCEGKVEVGHYGEVGDYIEGAFEIPDNPALGCERLTGNFRAKREK